MTTIRDVAQRAKVSVGTVSRVLNGHPSVRAPIRDAVRRAVEELDYRPNQIARRLRSTDSGLVALCVTDLRELMTTRAITGAQAAVAERGYTLVIADSRGDPKVELNNIENLAGEHVDGLLIYPLNRQREIQALKERFKLDIALFAQIGGHTSLPTAVVDDGPAIRSALQRISALGHRRIGFAGRNPGRAAPARNRLALVQSACKDEGVLTELEHVVMADSTGGSMRQLRELLCSSHPPTCLILGEYGLVAPAFKMLRAMDVCVPQDISLLAFGDSEWSEAVEPALTVISVDYEQHAYQSMCMLLDHLAKNRNAPKLISHTSDLIWRESCDAPGTPANLPHRRPD